MILPASTRFRSVSLQSCGALHYQMGEFRQDLEVASVLLGKCATRSAQKDAMSKTCPT